MKITVMIMKTIKDFSIIFLIAFIIASILYGIHMFRYEFIILSDQQTVIRYDRITNTQCISVERRRETHYRFQSGIIGPTKEEDGSFGNELIKACHFDPRISFR